MHAAFVLARPITSATQILVTGGDSGTNLTCVSRGRPVRRGLKVPSLTGWRPYVCGDGRLEELKRTQTDDRNTPMRAMLTWLMTVVVLGISGCGYNAIQTQDEQVKASWSEVLNQYQRRADLIPNLVNTVKGYASQEKEALMRVTEARARVGSVQASPELINDPQAFAKFEAAQAQLTSSLSRLLVVSENYPQLKSDANFRDLQAQLEGTENRITVARNRYIKAVQDYNTTVRSFPSNLTASVFGYKEKPNFSVSNEAEIARPPQVNFDTAPKPASGVTN